MARRRRGARNGPARRRGRGTRDAPDLAADLLTSLPDALVRVAGGVVEVAVPVATDVSAALGALAPDRAVGIGMGVRPGALVVSMRQAHSALPASRLQGRPVRVEEVASSRVVLMAAGAEALQAYSGAVLGPLEAADRAEDLLRALTAFLDHNGQWGAAAEASGVHRHTMTNRVAAIERLTGRRLDTAQDRYELWLALRARDVARFSHEPD